MAVIAQGLRRKGFLRVSGLVAWGARQEMGRRLLLCVSDGWIGCEGVGAAGGVTRDGRLLLRIALVGRGGG